MSALLLHSQCRDCRKFEPYRLQEVCHGDGRIIHTSCKDFATHPLNFDATSSHQSFVLGTTYENGIGFWQRSLRNHVHGEGSAQDRNDDMIRAVGMDTAIAHSQTRVFCCSGENQECQIACCFMLDRSGVVWVEKCVFIHSTKASVDIDDVHIAIGVNGRHYSVTRTRHIYDDCQQCINDSIVAKTSWLMQLAEMKAESSVLNVVVLGSERQARMRLSHLGQSPVRLCSTP